ncbi:MAG TPA: hypothetical protein VGU64_01855, partial [Terriglobales bacterium]|nr:hypothetical protein [Terriglobales bacterium]
MTDQLEVTLFLTALSPAPTSILEIRPRLIIRCRESKLDVYIATGSVLHAEDDMTPVRIRWGTAAPAEASWSRSTDYSAAFAPEPREFLNQLLENPDLRFEVHPYDAVPTVITFNARGLAGHMAQLDTACPIEKEQQADTVLVFSPGEDQVFMESVVEERPEILSVPALKYPDLLQQAGVQG